MEFYRRKIPVDDLEAIVSEIVPDTVVAEAGVACDAPDAVDGTADEKEGQCITRMLGHSRALSK
jgi:hypothetical protein